MSQLSRTNNRLTGDLAYSPTWGRRTCQAGRQQLPDGTQSRHYPCATYNWEGRPVTLTMIEDHTVICTPEQLRTGSNECNVSLPENRDAAKRVNSPGQPVEQVQQPQQQIEQQPEPERAEPQQQALPQQQAAPQPGQAPPPQQPAPQQPAPQQPAPQQPAPQQPAPQPDDAGEAWRAYDVDESGCIESAEWLTAVHDYAAAELDTAAVLSVTRNRC